MARRQYHKLLDLTDIDRDIAYRGYLIKTDQFNNCLYVSKGGFHIGTFDRVSDAKAVIDQIAD